MDSTVSQRVVTETVPPPKSAEASASGKRLNRKSGPLSVMLYNMEVNEIRELYDDREEPFYYARNNFMYRNKAQLRLDQEIEKAMAEYNERSRNLSVFDAIGPPRIAGLCGSVRPLTITDDKRLLLIRLCKLALEEYNTPNQGENFVFDNLVIKAQVWNRIPERGPPVIKLCSLKPT